MSAIPFRSLVAVLAVVAAPALTGCFGIPPGAVGLGDVVTATVTVEDAGSGDVLVDGQQMNFRVGSGASGLGFDFERAIMGAQRNDTVTFRLDPLRFSGAVERDATFGPTPLEGEIDRSQFEGAFGAPTVGEEFRPPQSFYSYRVEAATNTTVTYRVLPEDGQRNDVPNVGSILVTNVDEASDTMTQVLEPDVGATFVIRPPSPFQPETPLDLDPGSYQVLDSETGTLRLASHPTQFTSIVGHDLRVTVSIQNVQQGSLAEADGDNVGVRVSPQVNGQPSAVPDYGPFMEHPGDAMGEPMGDTADGHDDHTH